MDQWMTQVAKNFMLPTKNIPTYFLTFTSHGVHLSSYTTPNSLVPNFEFIPRLHTHRAGGEAHKAGRDTGGEKGRALDKRSRRTGDFLKYVIMISLWPPKKEGGQFSFRSCERMRRRGVSLFGPEGTLSVCQVVSV